MCYYIHEDDIVFGIVLNIFKNILEFIYLNEVYNVLCM